MTKKIQTSAIFCLFFCILLSACKKDQGVVTLTAQLPKVANNDNKLSINGFDTYWSNGDEMWINDQSSCSVNVTSVGSSATISNVTESDSYVAIFPSDIVRDDDISNLNTIQIQLPAEQYYEADDNGQKINIPMGAASNGRTLQFHNLCSLLKVTVSSTTNITLTSIEVSAMNDGVYLSGDGTATITGSSTDHISIGNDGCNWVSLTFPANNLPTLSSGESQDYYIVLPAFGSSSDSMDLMVTIFTTNGYYSQQVSNKYLPNNVIAATTCNVSGTLTKPVPDGVSVPQGAIAGAYTIATGTKVFFSKGNLQFNAAQGTHNVASGGQKSGTWRFAENQYDICGTNNQNISSSYDGWIDLFGWGTSGFDNTSEMPSATNFEPWSSNTSSSNYGPEAGYHLHSTPYFFDWGVYNTISSAPTCSWKTLTNAQWKYVMSSGATSRESVTSTHSQDDESAKMIFTKISVNGINGVLLCPDNFTCPIHYPCSMFQNSTTTWTNVRQFSAQQFLQFEKRGCVFIPAAGRRNNLSWETDNSLYWSSEYYLGSNRNQAKGTLITSNNIIHGDPYYRAFGGSVRLVHVIQ